MPRPTLRINGKVAAETGNEASLEEAPLPSWIWGSDNSKTQFLRRSFVVKGIPSSTRLLATCDNVMTVWINGKEVAESRRWDKPVSVDVLKSIVPGGKNIITAKAENVDGGAGFILKLVLNSADGTRTHVMIGDGGWKFSDQETAARQEAAFDDSAWQQPKEIGKFGIAPCGIPKTGSENLAWRPPH